MAKNEKITLYDVPQLQKRIYEEDNDAMRVSIVKGLENLVPQVQTVEVPTIIKEIVTEKIPVLIPQLEVIQVPTIVKEYEKIEVPVVIEKIVYKDISIWMKACIVAQAIILTILLLKK
jgi:hypothetical protein